MSEKKAITPQTPADNQSNQRKPAKKNITSIIAIVLFIQVILAVFVGILLFKRGYEQSKINTETKVRQDAYDTVYGIAERSNHVSNRVGITVDGIREKAELEVLQVDSSYLYVSDNLDPDYNQNIWYKIPGSGIFTVDMRMTEFIVDNERSHVLVKAPAPSITQFKENYDGIEKLFYANNRWLSNGSVQEGEAIARKMLTLAHVKMIKQLEMTPAYYQAAEEAARSLIANLIKSTNPGRRITVDIVFSN